MKTKCLARLALLAALLISLPPARGGSIEYDFHPREGFLGQVIGSLVADDSVLTRGVITNADMIRFSFPPFAAQALPAIAIGIGSDGVPTGGYTITASAVNMGVRYSLAVDFGPDAFNRNIMGNYQVSGGNTPGVFGRGWWTVDISPSVAVPEPSSLWMILVPVLSFIVFFFIGRASKKRDDRP